jgi:hypothetical protein
MVSSCLEMISLRPCNGFGLLQGDFARDNFGSETAAGNIISTAAIGKADLETTALGHGLVADQSYDSPHELAYLKARLAHTFLSMK